jgi:hypothetical protein
MLLMIVKVTSWANPWFVILPGFGSRLQKKSARCFELLVRNHSNGAWVKENGIGAMRGQTCSPCSGVTLRISGTLLETLQLVKGLPIFHQMLGETLRGRNRQNHPPDRENKEKPSKEGIRPGPPGPPPADQVLERLGGVVQVFEQKKSPDSDFNTDHPIIPSEATHKVGVVQVVQVESPNSGIFSICLPPSTPRPLFVFPLTRRIPSSWTSRLSTPGVMNTPSRRLPNPENCSSVETRVWLIHGQKIHGVAS